MTDERDDDALATQATAVAAAVTADEIAAFEKGVRDLIRYRSAFDKHFQALDDMLAEREQPTASEAAERGGARPLESPECGTKCGTDT